MADEMQNAIKKAQELGAYCTEIADELGFTFGRDYMIGHNCGGLRPNPRYCIDCPPVNEKKTALSSASEVADQYITRDGRVPSGRDVGLDR